MFKKTVAVIAGVVLLAGLSACGSEAATDTPKESSTTEETPKVEEKKVEPLNLTGTWKSEADTETGNYWEATVSADTITINWVFDNGATKSLYWEGSYTAPTDDVDTYEWTSTGDTEKMASALTASQDSEKKFSYAGEKLSYEASAMGVTTTVELSKA